MDMDTAFRPTTIAIFGGTGDLAQRKLLPALYSLFVSGQLPEAFTIIGIARSAMSDEEYRAFVAKHIAVDGEAHAPESVTAFCEHLRYVTGDFAEVATYEQLKTTLLEYDEEIAQCANKLFYLAVPPAYYELLFEQLHTSQALALCDEETSWARLLVEKPFGKDLETAQALEQKLCSLFADQQIYRIDHYLAKGAIENIVALRFANGVLADSWNGASVESVDITLREASDVSHRGSFYDAIGTLRDVGQNHMLQIFALLTMPPADIHDPQAVREARARALALLADCTPTDVVRGQYRGYRAVDGVAPESDTETYFKLSFTLPDETWCDTQFTFEAGKALQTETKEAVITFRPHNVCNCAAKAEEHEHRNVLRIQFAPHQHICLSLWTRAPGFAFALQEQEFTLVASSEATSAAPEAYERVLFDCIVGDQTRFVSGDEVELAWRFITPILERLHQLPLQEYDPGSQGPVAGQGY